MSPEREGLMGVDQLAELLPGHDVGEVLHLLELAQAAESDPCPRVDLGTFRRVMAVGPRAGAVMVAPPGLDNTVSTPLATLAAPPRELESAAGPLLGGSSGLSTSGDTLPGDD